MENFSYQLPARIHFGRGAISQAGAEAATLGKNVLVVAGPDGTEAGQKLSASLNEAGCKATIHTVEAGSAGTLPGATAAAKAGRDAQASCVIGLGDTALCATAQIAAYGLYDPDRVWDQLPRLGEDKALERAAALMFVPLQPLACWPDLAGGNLANPATGERVAFRHDLLAPKACILDPEITYTQPKEETIAACSLVLVQLLDSYFNGAENTPIQDRFAESLFETIMENLPVIQSNPANYTSRANLLWLGMAASAGFITAGNGANAPLTALALRLSGQYNIPLARAYTTLLPAFLLAAYQDNPEPIARLGHRLFGLPIMSPTMEEAAYKGIMQLRKWLHGFGALHTLSSAGIPKEALDDIIAAASGLANQGQLNGMVDFTADRAAALVQLAAQ